MSLSIRINYNQCSHQKLYLQWHLVYLPLQKRCRLNYVPATPWSSAFYNYAVRIRIVCFLVVVFFFLQCWLAIVFILIYKIANITLLGGLACNGAHVCLSSWPSIAVPCINMSHTPESRYMCPFKPMLLFRIHKHLNIFEARLLGFTPAPSPISGL